MLCRLALMTVLACLTSIPADAEWFGKRGKHRHRGASKAAQRVPNQYRTPYPTTTGRMSVGIFSYPNYNYPRPGEFDPYRFDNYVYDAYQFGSFETPDLLNDPYFRERHRYESHFPGRRKAR